MINIAGVDTLDYAWINLVIVVCGKMSICVPCSFLRFSFISDSLRNASDGREVRLDILELEVAMAGRLGRGESPGNFP